MHKLIILRGNSGSGKTSVAKALQEKFGPNTMLHHSYGGFTCMGSGRHPEIRPLND